MVARFATVTEEEIRQMNEEATPANTKSTCLVNTKTTIPLSVGAQWKIFTSPLRGSVEYISLFTSTSGDSC